MPRIVPDVKQAYRYMRRVAANPILAVFLRADRFIRAPIMRPQNVRLQVNGLSHWDEQKVKAAFAAARTAFMATSVPGA